VSRTLDEKFPEWGESNYYTVELEQEISLQKLLTHLYVLIPVLDAEKHYYKRENPRLCRGDSRCLTTPGVHPRNSKREPAKHT
jgi:hypothetical protein